MVNTFSTFKQFVGLAKETTQGTAVAPTQTIPVTKFDPEDKPVALYDKSWTGSMSLDRGLQLGVVKTTFSMSGYVLADTVVPLLVNIMGDRTTSFGAVSTTLSSGASAAATTISTAVTVPVGSTLSIDTGSLQETVTVSAVSGAGPFTVTVSALKFAHASSTVVTVLYQHAVSLYNGTTGQPPTHTFTHFQGPVASTGARTYAGGCLDSLNMKFNAATEYFEFDAKGQAWSSQPAGTTPTSAPSAVTPIPSWRGKIGVAGVAAGGTLSPVICDGTIDIKRKLTDVFTVQGSQDPYIIQRGETSVDGKLTVVATDETFYNYMRNNTQPQLQMVWSGGGTVFQVDMQNVAMETAKFSAKELIEYDMTYKGLLNSVNPGASGGLSQALFTVQNNTAATNY